MKKIPLEHWVIESNEDVGLLRILTNGAYLLELNAAGIEVKIEDMQDEDSAILTVQPMIKRVMRSGNDTVSGKDYPNYDLSAEDLSEFHAGEMEPVEFTFDDKIVVIGLMDVMSEATADWMFS